MRTAEVIYPSLNTFSHPKPITALVVEPDIIGPETGLMLFTHGWRGNRFLHQDKMEWAAERYNIVTLSVEFRQSGYDFDAVTGRGSYVPYDTSFYQVFDVLNGLRYMLQQHPNLNRRRIYHYGGSQGGHIALLGTLFAPSTFAWIYTSCALTHTDTKIVHELSGRYFAPWERAIRSPLELAEHIPCPVYLEYGTEDLIVPHESHSLALAARLAQTGRLVRQVEYSGGGHSLAPTTTKLAAFQAMSEHLEWTATTAVDNDFDQGSMVRIPCGNRTLVIDWSKPSADTGLAQWES